MIVAVTCVVEEMALDANKLLDVVVTEFTKKAYVDPVLTWVQREPVNVTLDTDTAPAGKRLSLAEVKGKLEMTALPAPAVYELSNISHIAITSVPIFW